MKAEAELTKIMRLGADFFKSPENAKDNEADVSESPNDQKFH